MKYILLVLLTLSAVSCASHQGESRKPSSEEMMDVSRGINTDSYGIPASR